MPDIIKGEEQREAAKQELILLMKNLREQLANHPFLDRVKNGELSVEQWQTFAVQRYLAANNFEALLEAGIHTARESGDENLANILQSNLNDETGVKDGKFDPDMAHSKWREDFYGAMGVGEEQLKETQPLDSTKAYAEEMAKLSKEDLLKIAGAILFLEFSIPKEFTKMQEGRDKTFTRQFVDDPDNDTEEVLEQKRKARLYLDDHIEHDAQFHYPDLLRALESYLANPDALAKVKEGVERIAKVKKSFYDGLQE